jgi:hypothetical protein
VRSRGRMSGSDGSLLWAEWCLRAYGPLHSGPSGRDKCGRSACLWLPAACGCGLLWLLPACFLVTTRPSPVATTRPPRATTSYLKILR